MYLFSVLNILRKNIFINVLKKYDDHVEVIILVPQLFGISSVWPVTHPCHRSIRPSDWASHFPPLRDWLFDVMVRHIGIMRERGEPPMCQSHHYITL